MHQLVFNCIVTGSGVDFDSGPFNLTFATREVIESVNISLMCDKIVEQRENFDISLMLISNNPQVSMGSRDTSEVVIIDHTGKYDDTVERVGNIIIE